MKSRIGLLLILVAALLHLARSDNWMSALGLPPAQLKATAAVDAPSGTTVDVRVEREANPAEPVNEPAATAVDASAPQSVAAAPVVASLRTFTAAEARAAMLEHWRVQDCAISKFMSTTSTQLRRERAWRWLPPERADVERRETTAAIARLVADCPPAIADAAELKRRQQQAQADLAAAKAAGDLYARMQLTPPRGRYPPERAAEARAVMYDVVLSGDLEAISRLAGLDAYAHIAGNTRSMANLVDFHVLWPLVACDLGMDCGPGSRVMDRACLEIDSGCAYPDFEALVRDRSPPWRYRLTDQRRRELVAHIRSGQIAGMFDPPLTPPGDG